MKKHGKAAIIGGGVAGASAALVLGELGVDITLFEAGGNLVSGPPMCHLHAGGNLYRDISDEQCIRLLKESIEFVRLYPAVIDYRPTVIAVPTEDSNTAASLLPRLERVQKEYERLIAIDPENEVLGASSDYYRLYDRADLERLKNLASTERVGSFDRWMIPVAKGVDLDSVQYPLVLVQEFGINMFRLGAGVTLALREMENGRLMTETLVHHIEPKPDGEGWILTYENDGQRKKETFDFLINAAGYRSGEIDEMLGYDVQRFLEFKAAYVTQWKENSEQWPETIFHGERGDTSRNGAIYPLPWRIFPAAWHDQNNYTL